MTEVILFSLIIVGIVWLSVDTQKESSKQKDINTKLFARTWKHERFLMEIYADCPKDVREKIEKYMNEIEAL